MAKFLSFDYGKHRVEVPAVSLTLSNPNNKKDHVAILAHSGLRVKLASTYKPVLVNGRGK